MYIHIEFFIIQKGQIFCRNTAMHTPHQGWNILCIKKNNIHVWASRTPVDVHKAMPVCSHIALSSV
jgi:hypothetical protein